ncbi:MAG: DUF2764 family protein [FCB group bacterium]|nr:DUF2764 family protein [FCB group bacterium]
MDKYIYFAAEMPMLRWGDEQFPSIHDFLEEARKWMTPADYAVLIKALITHYTEHAVPGVYAAYLKFERTLRKELAAYRQARKEGYEYKFSRIPAQLVKEGNPLEVEKHLMHHRWKWLDEQEFGHYSDRDFFVIYYLKLQLLHRLAMFMPETGEKHFETYVTTNLEKKEKHEESSG